MGARNSHSTGMQGRGSFNHKWHIWYADINSTEYPTTTYVYWGLSAEPIYMACGKEIKAVMITIKFGFLHLWPPCCCLISLVRNNARVQHVSLYMFYESGDQYLWYYCKVWGISPPPCALLWPWNGGGAFAPNFTESMVINTHGVFSAHVTHSLGARTVYSARQIGVSPNQKNTF